MFAQVQIELGLLLNGYTFIGVFDTVEEPIQAE
jgi:hypothetical protein